MDAGLRGKKDREWIRRGVAPRYTGVGAAPARPVSAALSVNNFRELLAGSLHLSILQAHALLTQSSGERIYVRVH